jgi:hypothetical protein
LASVLAAPPEQDTIVTLDNQTDVDQYQRLVKDRRNTPPRKSIQEHIRWHMGDTKSGGRHSTMQGRGGVSQGTQQYPGQRTRGSGGKGSSSEQLCTPTTTSKETNYNPTSSSLDVAEVDQKGNTDTEDVEWRSILAFFMIVVRCSRSTATTPTLANAHTISRSCTECYSP